MNDDTFGWFLAVLLLLATMMINGLFFEPQRGEEWGSCYPNATCDEGMTCHRERCVMMEVE